MTTIAINLDEPVSCEVAREKFSRILFDIATDRARYSDAPLNELDVDLDIASNLYRYQSFNTRRTGRASPDPVAPDRSAEGFRRLELMLGGIDRKVEGMIGRISDLEKKDRRLRNSRSSGLTRTPII